MNSRHRKTLTALFATPMPANLDWSDIEALFLACGAASMEGNGSRVRFVLNNVVASFHRPHPDKVAKRYQIKDARDFLEKAGIQREGL